MLTLGLKLGEYIMIGEDIKITVIDQKSSNIYLGIEVPDDKRVLREKLYEQLVENGMLVLKNGETLCYDGKKISELEQNSKAV